MIAPLACLRTQSSCIGDLNSVLVFFLSLLSDLSLFVLVGKQFSLRPGIESTIRRVLEDSALGAVAFELEIDNHTNTDFTYDPQSLEMKGKDQTYDAVLEEAAGMVKAASSETVYLVVNDAGAPEPDGLIADGELGVALKKSQKNSELTFDQPTSGYLPTALTVHPPPEATNPVGCADACIQFGSTTGCDPGETHSREEDHKEI